LCYLVIERIQASVAVGFFVDGHLDWKVVEEDASSLAGLATGDVISPKKVFGFVF
jgi:hypothetical protein